MKSKLTFAISMSWGARFVSLITQIVFLPILLKYLDSESSGLWILLFQLNSFVALLEFGYGAALTRRLSFELAKSEVNFADLLATAKQTIYFISFFALIFSSVVGCTIIYIMDGGSNETLHAWLLLCAGNALRINQSNYRATLNAYKYIGIDSLIAILQQIFLVLLQVYLLSVGGGVVSLALAFLISIVFAQILFKVFNYHLLPRMSRGRFSKAFVLNDYKLMLKGWLTGIGAYFLLKTDYMFVGYFGGMSEVASFYAINQLTQNVHILAISLAVASTPYVSNLYRLKDLAAIRKILIRNSNIAFVTWSIAATFLVVDGGFLISLWIGSDKFVGVYLTALLILASLLETTHILVSTTCRATGLEEFYKTSIVAAFVNVVLSFVLGARMGLEGVVIATICAQLFVNVFYAYHKGLMVLDMPVIKYMASVSYLPLFYGVVNFIMLNLVNKHLEDRVVCIVVGVLCSALLFVIAFYNIMFKAPKRLS